MKRGVVPGKSKIRIENKTIQYSQVKLCIQNDNLNIEKIQTNIEKKEK